MSVQSVTGSENGDKKTIKAHAGEKYRKQQDAVLLKMAGTVPNGRELD